jgi:hypothetical protein
MPQPKLFEYGIQLERSDIRVHVSPSTRRLYVFPTAEAQRLLDQRGADFPAVTATQPGVEYVTAIGKLVPCNDMPLLQVVTLDHYAWWQKFKPTYATSTKGRMAVSIVLWALRNGRLPLWIRDARESASCKVQRSGTDILIWARFRIQVKCDWSAGPVEWGGSGNIFLQEAELNPLKRH